MPWLSMVAHLAGLKVDDGDNVLPTRAWGSGYHLRMPDRMVRGGAGAIVQGKAQELFALFHELAIQHPADPHLDLFKLRELDILGFLGLGLGPLRRGGGGFGLAGGSGLGGQGLGLQGGQLGLHIDAGKRASPFLSWVPAGRSP